MTPSGKTFEIDWEKNRIKIEEYRVRESIVYKANLINQPVLFLTKTKDSDKIPFWTSIPEGRLELADQIGSLIDAITNKSKNQTNNKSTQTELF